MDQIYSFKNKNYFLYNSLLRNFVQNFRANRQAVLVLALEENDNLWFIIISLLVHHQNSRHSSFNLARSTCTFYWSYIFSFVFIFTKNSNTEIKTRYSYRKSGTETLSWDPRHCDGTLGWDSWVGHWRGNLWWDQGVGLSFPRKDTVFSKKFKHTFKIGWHSEAVIRRCSTK